MPADSPLSAKHEAFAVRVAGGEAASRAYGAVYRPFGATAHANGSRLLRNAKVAERIRALQGETAAKCEFKKEQVLRFLADFIRTPAGRPSVALFERVGMAGAKEAGEDRVFLIPCKRRISILVFLEA